MPAWRVLGRASESNVDGKDGPSASIMTPETLARRGGFLRDAISVSERALRSIKRDPEVTVSALFIPVFMYVMTVGALNDIAEGIPGLNYRAFQIPVAVLFAVTGISRALVVVTDIQTGYFDRLVVSPINRLALLLGLMIADFARVVALTVPVIIMSLYSRCELCHRRSWDSVVHVPQWTMGADLHRLSLRHRPENGQPGGGQHQLPALLSSSLHDHLIHASRGDDWLAQRGCRL